MKPLSELLNDWRRARLAFENLTKSLPRLIGSTCVIIVKENFRLQGYDTGNGIQKWDKRSPATDKAYTYGRSKGGKSKFKGSVYNAANPILRQTNNLYNAQKYWITGRTVTIGVDALLIPYAKKMNEGGPGKWGKNTTNTPARQYIPKPNDGPNAKMLKAIVKKINFERNKALGYFQK